MNIAVWCGSSEVKDPTFKSEAAALGKWIARQGHTLIFGASGTGLMSALSNACIEAGGNVHGVSVRVASINEAINPHVTEVEILPTLAARKARMIEMADAIIALPGGPGTLDELTDCLVLLRLKQRSFPCILYNVSGYFDMLSCFFDRMTDEGFAGDEMDNVHFCNNLTEIGRILHV